MKKITYGTIQQEVSKEVSIVKIEAKGKEHEIEVLQYLPIKEKIGIVSTVVQLSIVDGLVRRDISQALLNVSMVEKYAGITFSESVKKDTMVLYDELKSNGVLDKIIEAIPEKEVDFIANSTIVAIESLQENMKYSMSGLIGQKMSQSESAEIAKDFLSNILPNAEK